MTSIRLVAIEPPGKDLTVPDSAQAFDIAEKLHASTLDVLNDGKYTLSLQRIPLPAEECYWELFQRTGGSLAWMGHPERWKSIVQKWDYGG